MNHQGLLRTLSDLIHINSVNPAYLAGRPEKEIQDFVFEFFSSRGIDAVEQQVSPGRANVIAKLPGRNTSRRIIFEAHSDTAGVEDMAIAPFEPEIKHGRIYGRGACDTKAGLAAMMHAAADLKCSNASLSSEVWVVATVDEEHLARGAVKLREGSMASAAVVSEPTGMKVIVASKGCLRWRITVRGKAAHSSKPHLGVNAIEQMGRVLDALRSETARLHSLSHPLTGPPTLMVGLIQGGSQVNMVPERCWIEVDRRLTPGEDQEEVLNSYRALLEELGSTYPGLHATMESPTVQEPPCEIPVGSTVVRTAVQVLKELGMDDEPGGVPFGSNANKLSEVQIPCIVLGPGSIDQAHTAEEYVEIDQLEKAFVVYRELMKRLE
jgi:acetylornithine deacetylase